MISKNTYLKIKNFKWEKLLFKKKSKDKQHIGGSNFPAHDELILFLYSDQYVTETG